MAEEIVTRFTANVDDLKVKIDVATRSLTAVSDAQAKLTAQTNNLAKANKEAAQEEAKATASRQASLAAIEALVNKREDLRQIIVRTKTELKEYNKALEGIKGTGEFEEQKLTAALAKTQEKLVALQALLPKYAAKKRELEKADQAAATAEDQARKATEAARKAYKASFTDLSALIEKEKQLKVATDQTTASIGAQAKTSQGGFAIPPPPPGTTVRPQPGPLGPLPDEDQFTNLGAIEGAADAASKKVGDLEAKTRTLVATEQALAKATKDAGAGISSQVAPAKALEGTYDALAASGPKVSKAFDEQSAKATELVGKINALKSNFQDTVDALVSGGAEPAKALETTTRSIEELQVELAKLEIPEGLADEAIKALAPLNEIEESAKGAADGLQEIGAKGAPAVEKLANAEDRASNETKQTNQYIHEEIGLIGQLKSRIDLLNQKKNALGDPKEIAKVNQQIRVLEERLRNLNSAGFQEAINGVRNLGGGIGAATSSFGTFGSTALGLLGPIGLGVGAVATGLLAVARNTDAGQVAIDGFGRTSGLVFDRITGKVKDLFAVLSGDGVVGQVFQKLAAGAEFFIKTLSPIAPILALLKVTGISDAFAEDVAEGQRLAQAYDDLEDKQNALNEKTAANEIIIRKNLAALRDVTKPVAERLKLADQITASEKENLALKKVQLYAELAILNARAKGQLDRKGEVDDALKAEISALRAGLSTLEADSISLTERVSVRRNAILDGEQATNEARLAKEKAARDKAFNEEKQRIEKLSALREQAAQTREELERDALRRQTLGEDGTPTISTQILDVDFRVEDQIDAANENAKKQEELAKGNAAELERIAQELATNIVLIRAQGNAEVDALTTKFYKTEEEKAEAATAAIEDALLTDDDRQLNAISKKYDELLKLTDKLTVNEAEKGRIRAQLLLARERELTEIIDEEGRKRLEIQVKLIEELGEGVGQALALLATSFSIGENDINAQFDQQLSDLQEANQRELDEIARRNGSQAELEEARNRATASYMDERNRIEQERGKELQENRERQEKEFLKLLLDTLEKVVQIYVAEVIVKQIADGAAQGGVPGALAGAAIGAAIAAIISGIFSALKSSIGGAYRGEEMIGGPAFFNGSRDTHLRRVHPKERIISADKNVKHYDVLHAIHTDKFDQWKRANLMVEMPAMDHLVMPEINRYLDGDTGQRMAASVMLMKYHDKNIVESTNRTTKAQQKTNVLLEQLVEAVANKPGRGAHYW